MLRDLRQEETALMYVRTFHRKCNCLEQFKIVLPGCDVTLTQPSLALVKELQITANERSVDGTETKLHPDDISLLITPDTGQAFTPTLQRTAAMQPDGVHVVLDEPVNEALTSFQQTSLEVRVVVFHVRVRHIRVPSTSFTYEYVMNVLCTNHL